MDNSAQELPSDTSSVPAKALQSTAREVFLERPRSSQAPIAYEGDIQCQKPANTSKEKCHVVKMPSSQEPNEKLSDDDVMYVSSEPCQKIIPNQASSRNIQSGSKTANIRGTRGSNAAMENERRDIPRISKGMTAISFHDDWSSRTCSPGDNPFSSQTPEPSPSSNLTAALTPANSGASSSKQQRISQSFPLVQTGLKRKYEGDMPVPEHDNPIRTSSTVLIADSEPYFGSGTVRLEAATRDQPMCPSIEKIFPDASNFNWNTLTWENQAPSQQGTVSGPLPIPALETNSHPSSTWDRPTARFHNYSQLPAPPISPLLPTWPPQQRQPQAKSTLQHPRAFLSSATTAMAQPEYFSPANTQSQTPRNNMPPWGLLQGLQARPSELPFANNPETNAFQPVHQAPAPPTGKITPAYGYHHPATPFESWQKTAVDSKEGKRNSGYFSTPPISPRTRYSKICQAKDTHGVLEHKGLVKPSVFQSAMSRNEDGTATNTPSLYYTSDLIIDIARTCQRNFPFEEVAKRHKVKPEEVIDTFSAVVQFPLLRHASQIHKNGSLAMQRLKQFNAAKKAAVEAREAGTLKDALETGTKSSDRGLSSHVYSSPYLQLSCEGSKKSGPKKGH
ncbi:hypothetical protein BP6252_05293 [Coleophoma cylindrospora]|uniref:Uncharacterized protein n=1 Tax=Coleophoma cylindrospora TaxID=1849047 RepID=A0A3D8RTF6_9HELO|nr:hypothetical protein BP6252_05293 [Coleophoma cylindrospora]